MIANPESRPAGQTGAAATGIPVTRAPQASGVPTQALKAAVVALGLAVVAVVTALLGYIVHTDAEATRSSAMRQNLTLANAFSGHVTAAVDLVESVLRETRGRWQRDANILEQAQLDRAVPNFRGFFFQVAMIGADGWMKASSLGFDPKAPVSLGDRPHFLYHKDQARPTDQLYIGKPLVGRVSKRPSIQFTRPVLGKTGEFQGVMVASTHPDFFERFVRQLGAEPNTVAALVGSDGAVRLWIENGTLREVPAAVDPDLLAATQRQERGEVTTQSGGVTRYWGFSRLGGYPLTVMIGTREDEVMRGHTSQRWLILAAWVVFVLAVALFTRYIVQGIGRQRLLLDNLHMSQMRADSANRMKSQFLANVSHDLRTPLNGILGLAELVKRQDPDPVYQRYGELIHRSATQLHGLVNTMLDLARIEAGRMELDPRTVRLHELLDGIATLHRVTAEKKGLTFKVDIDAQVPHQVETDPIKLGQVLHNVLHNAVKYTPQGAVGLQVTGDRGSVHMVVTDSGPGIEPGRLGSIFERFGKTRDDSEVEGAGLGLALSRELVHLLGGRITLSSEPGHGTRVDIWLPATLNQK